MRPWCRLRCRASGRQGLARVSEAGRACPAPAPRLCPEPHSILPHPGRLWSLHLLGAQGRPYAACLASMRVAEDTLLMARVHRGIVAMCALTHTVSLRQSPQSICDDCFLAQQEREYIPWNGTNTDSHPDLGIRAHQAPVQPPLCTEPLKSVNAARRRATSSLTCRRSSLTSHLGWSL